MRYFFGLLLLVGLIFCVVGFVASFEPKQDGTAHYKWMASYAVGGVLCLVGALWLIIPRRERR